MSKSLDYYRKHILPDLHNQYFGKVIENLLSTIIHTAGYDKMRELLDNPNSDARGCVQTSSRDRYVRTNIQLKFDEAPGSWSSTSKFSHHATPGGLLEHSQETAKFAEIIWNNIKSVLQIKLEPLLIEDGYSKESIDQWYEDMDDIVKVGAFLHDIGKVAMVSPNFHGYGTQKLRMHEQFGYWILGLPWHQYSKCFTSTMSSGTETYKMGMVLGFEMCCIGHSAYFLDNNHVMQENHHKFYAQKSLLIPFIVALADKMSASRNRNSEDYSYYRGEYYAMYGDLMRGEGRYKIVNLGKKPVPSDFIGNEVIERNRYGIEHDYNGSKFLLEIAW